MKRWVSFDESKCFEETKTLSGSMETEERNLKTTDSENKGQGSEDTIYAILRHTVIEIQNGGRWQATPEVREAETDINRTFAEAVAGKRTVEDFRAVCRRWKEAGTRQSGIRKENNHGQRR
jgi:hypothetical protein